MPPKKQPKPVEVKCPGCGNTITVITRVKDLYECKSCHIMFSLK